MPASSPSSASPCNRFRDEGFLGDSHTAMARQDLGISRSGVEAAFVFLSTALWSRRLMTLGGGFRRKGRRLDVVGNFLALVGHIYCTSVKMIWRFLGVV